MAPPKGVPRSEETRAKLKAAWERRRAEGKVPPKKPDPPGKGKGKGWHFRPGGPSYDPRKAAKGPGMGPGWGDSSNHKPAGNLKPEEYRALERQGMVDAKTAAEEARKHATRAVGVWAEVMDDVDAPAAARVIAADKMVERAEGKPVQPIVTAQAREPIPFDMGLLSPDEQEVFDKVLLKLAHKNVAPLQIEAEVEE